MFYYIASTVYKKRVLFEN